MLRSISIESYNKALNTRQPQIVKMNDVDEQSAVKCKHKVKACGGCKKCPRCTFYERTPYCDDGAHLENCKPRGRPPGARNKKRPAPESIPTPSRPKRRSVENLDYSDQLDISLGLIERIRNSINDAISAYKDPALQKRIRGINSEALNSRTGQGMAVRFIKQIMSVILKAATVDTESMRTLESLVFAKNEEIAKNEEVPEKPPVDVTTVVTKFACNTVKKHERKLMLSVLCNTFPRTTVNIFILVNKLIIFISGK